MASLVNRNGTYYANWHDAHRSPRQRRLSLRTTSKRAAKQLLGKLDDAYRLGTWDPWIYTLDEFFGRPQELKRLGEVVELFLATKRPRLREETTRTYDSILNRLADHLGAQTPVERLAVRELGGFVNGPGLAASTQRLRFRVARAFCNWAEREGHLVENPIRQVEPARPEGQVPRAVNEAQLEAVCRAVETDYEERLGIPGSHRVHEGELIWLVPLFRFAFYTGMRASELARLRWGHIDPDRRVIRIDVQKSRKEGVIPLSRKGLEVLGAVKRGEPEDFVFRSARQEARHRSARAFKNRVTELFARYRDEAGVPSELTFHSLRHGFCTALAEAGVSPVVIKEAARHSSVSVSMVYVHLTQDHVRREIDAAFEAA